MSTKVVHVRHARGPGYAVAIAQRRWPQHRCTRIEWQPSLFGELSDAYVFLQEREVSTVIRKPKSLVCACGCGEKFVPRIKTQLYVNYQHKNLAGQRRFRVREELKQKGQGA